MSKSPAKRPAKSKPAAKRPPAPVQPAWQRMLAANAEILALIGLIAVGLLIAGQLRVDGGQPSLLSQLLGWAALPALSALFLAALAVLLRQATQRIGLRDRLPWRRIGGSLAGLGLLFLAALGLSHLWSGSDDPLQHALAGKGGGLAGWLIGSLPGQLLGDLVATGLLAALAGLGLWLMLRSLDLLAVDWSQLPQRVGGWLAYLLPSPPEEEGEQSEPAAPAPPAPRAARPAALEERPSIASAAPLPAPGRNRCRSRARRRPSPRHSRCRPSRGPNSCRR